MVADEVIERVRARTGCFDPAPAKAGDLDCGLTGPKPHRRLGEREMRWVLTLLTLRLAKVR